VEKTHIETDLQIDQGGLIPTVDDFRSVQSLEIKPPDVARYFVRVKPDALDRFASEKKLTGLSEQEIADEFIFQNSLKINNQYYSSLGDKRAFVMSHAKNLIILKIVGYAEAAVQYYCMEDARAHVWIAHQRYPTKGRVWHPGGAHPFIGLNEALVHNGDFANYHSVCEYLAQRNLFPQFLTDTEVSVMLFDLMNRVYKYPLEYIIEALAPTTELDFDRLPEEKQRVYREIQAAHSHASPDGPWFFIIARNLTAQKGFQLVGITDTAMLRPQVFALQQGEVSIGLICSEKQAIDATLANLAQEDPRFTPVADKYWNARGGSYSDGGAFMMSILPENGTFRLEIKNKFDLPVTVKAGQKHCDLSTAVTDPEKQAAEHDNREIDVAIQDHNAHDLFLYFKDIASDTDYSRIRWFVRRLAEKTAKQDPAFGIEILTLCLNRRYPTGHKKRSSIQTIVRRGLESVFAAQPLLGDSQDAMFARVTWETRADVREPAGKQTTLIIDARGFSSEGADCDASLAVKAHDLGWKRFIHFNSKGTRFHAAGFGPDTRGVRVDCYDNPGDYLASGMDGLEAYVHGNAQDQLCQIAKSGKLVVYGDVGQTFLYGAKGGEIYVLGNVAGRPMINAVGRPRVVINGTALDFLAESLMAGDPHKGGGFAVVNGMYYDDDGRLTPLELPYPGSNLLSLAAGGAIYIRDPFHTLVDEQLNGGVYRKLTLKDWKLILPYLEENQRLFGIDIEKDLLTVHGEVRKPHEVYKKVVPARDAEPDEDSDS
jgi:glutamate synthase domain-containing protein 1/glutamate synthase domain-containing protein 3